jgi:hypothetical protein
MSIVHFPAKPSRWSIAARIIAAIGGGYMFTALVTVAVSLVLAQAGMAKAEAVITATLPCFAIFAVVIMAAFRAQSATRLWIWMAGASASLIAVILLLRPGSGP